MGKYNFTPEIVRRYKSYDLSNKAKYIDHISQDPVAYDEFIDLAYDEDYYEKLKDQPAQIKQDMLYELDKLAPRKFQELTGRIKQSQAEVTASGWERAMQGATESAPMKAADWWNRNVQEPLAANVYSGLTGGEMGWEAARKGYREWDSPWGVKGALEMAVDPTTYIWGGGLLKVGKKALRTSAREMAEQTGKQAIDDALLKNPSLKQAVEAGNRAARREVTKIGEKAAQAEMKRQAASAGTKGLAAKALINTGEQIVTAEQLPATVLRSTGKLLTGGYTKGAYNLSDEGLESAKSLVKEKELELGRTTTSGGHKVVVKELEDARDHVRRIESGRAFGTHLENAQRATDETQDLYSQARKEGAERLSKVFEEKEGVEAFEEAKKVLQRELPKADFEAVGPKMTDDQINDLVDLVRTSRDLKEYDKVTAMRGLTKILNGVVPQNAELKYLETLFGDSFVGSVLRKRGLMRKLLEFTTDLANFPRAVLASFDFSAPLRQGLFLQAGHWKESINAYPAMFKAMLRESNMVAAHEAMESSKWFETARAYGLHYAPMPVKGQTAALSEYEEAFMTRLANYVPGIKQSQRAYTTYLNRLRHDVFSNVAENWQKQGYLATESDYKALANFCNVASGRGRLPEFMNNQGALLSTMFFSPRLQAARIELPSLLVSSTPAVRREFLKNGWRLYTAGTSALALAKMAGAEVEMDPRSADFGKIKSGYTRFDIWGGNQQYVRFLANLVSGEVKSSSGLLYPQEGQETAERFVKGKLSPTVGMALEAWTGETYLGDEYAPDAEYAQQKLVPMVIQDSIDTWNEEGAFMAGIATPLAFHGMGVQSYGKGTMQEVRRLREEGLTNYNAENGTNYDWSNTPKHIRRQVEENNPRLKELVDELQNDTDKFHGSETEKAIKAYELKSEERFSERMKSLALARNANQISWKQYNELRTKYFNSRYSVKEMVREIGSLFTDVPQEEIEERIRNNTSAYDNAMRDYKMILAEPIRDAYGMIDWEETHDKADKYLASMSADKRNYIREHEDDWINELDPTIKQVEQDRKTLEGLLEPYWEVKGQVLDALNPSQRNYYDQYQKLKNQGYTNEMLINSGYGSLVRFIRKVDGRMRELRDRLRQQNPKLDYAVRVWY